MSIELASNLVGKSAKLQGIKGSPQERNKIASKLNLKMYALVQDTFKKRLQKGETEYITSEEISGHFQKLCKNIKLDLETCMDKTSHGTTQESISIDGGFHINGLKVELPFENLNGKSVITNKELPIETLTHEFRHVFDKITNPKTYLESINAVFSKHIDKTREFYTTQLYKFNETGVDKKTLRKNIQKLFDDNNITKSEQRATLYKWRSSMQSEQHAFRDGEKTILHPTLKQAKAIIASGKDIELEWPNIKENFDSSKYKTNSQKQVALTKFKKTVMENFLKTEVDQNLHFPEKIEVVEQMLKDLLKEKRANK